MIIHFLPENIGPCGGIKVHYDLSEIEKELGIESIIAFPNSDIIPKWMVKRDTGRILSYREAQQLGYTYKKQGKNVVIIGTEQTLAMDTYFDNSFIKCCYIQGHVFWDPFSNSYNDKKILCVSDFVKNYLSLDDSFVIEPFVRRDIFYFRGFNTRFNDKEIKILIQKRKGGDEVKNKIIEALFSKYSTPIINIFKFIVLEDVKELEFADFLRKADIFINHSYPEGFGLPGLEAMSCGTLVVGYTGGGGNVYMNRDNSFIVRDGDIEGIADCLYNILFTSKNILEVMCNNGYKTSLKFNKENTVNQLKLFLKGINYASF